MQLFKNKDADESVAARKNWYSDRYQTVLVQRNFLLLLTLISLVCIMVSVLAVIRVTSSKSIEPFVIEIEEKTGITNVIRPLLREQFAYDETLRRYFIMKYLTARETYAYGSFKHNYYTVVRLLSAGDVYSSFVRSVSSDNLSSPVRMGAKGERDIKVKSVTPLKTTREQKGFTYQIRFLATNKGASNVKKENLVATMTFDYFDLNLTREERDVNPLGFQVTGYRTDEETL